jgi:Zn-dependent protease with chaperone function
VGQVLGQGTLPIPANGHASFNLSQVPNVPANFTGNVAIMAQTTGQVFAAWAVYSDTSGVISSLPDGRAAFPQSQPDQVINAFNRLVVAYETLLPDFGAAPQLVISPEDDANAINAHASNGNTVQINLALAELISDSPSELAFVIAHELGHIYQQRTTKLGWSQNIEWDADEWGLLMELLAGYDPYAGAGALGKLAMATATAGLQAQLMQNWEQLSGVDAHASFGTRIDNLTTFVEAICGYSPNAQSLCAQYKTLVHPHFPALPSVPLIRKNPTKVNGPSPE